MWPYCLSDRRAASVLGRSYTDNTVQRYYQFNTSMPDVVTNVGAGGEYCKQYQIVAVPGTNVFVGVVNQTCDNPAFCACSRVSAGPVSVSAQEDRGCLNCVSVSVQEDRGCLNCVSVSAQEDRGCLNCVCVCSELCLCLLRRTAAV